jgi:membrane-bound lytic murein transglycosylase A
MSKQHALLIAFLVIFVCFWGACRPKEQVVIPFRPPEELAELDSIAAEKKARAGKPRQVSVNLIKALPDTFPFLKFDFDLLNALDYQEDYLRRKTTSRLPLQGISKRELIRTVETLRYLPFYSVASLAEQFDFYRLNTDIKNDKVRVTGYYTPIIEARKTQGDGYEFPLLRNPDRSITHDTTAIHTFSESALAWVKTEKELTNAQLQGSCLIQFPDGERQFLGFGGSMKRASGTYVYFKKGGNKVMGAGSFPMTAGYSLAVDPKVVPIGSCLFAELPNLNKAGNLIGYTYQIVLAQDRGGAIKTSKRVDLYAGIGKKGLENARKVNKYGRLWLILPKEN